MGIMLTCDVQNCNEPLSEETLNKKANHDDPVSIKVDIDGDYFMEIPDVCPECLEAFKDYCYAFFDNGHKVGKVLPRVDAVATDKPKPTIAPRSDNAELESAIMQTVQNVLQGNVGASEASSEEKQAVSVKVEAPKLTEREKPSDGHKEKVDTTMTDDIAEKINSGKTSVALVDPLPPLKPGGSTGGPNIPDPNARGVPKLEVDRSSRNENLREPSRAADIRLSATAKDAPETQGFQNGVV